MPMFQEQEQEQEPERRPRPSPSQEKLRPIETSSQPIPIQMQPFSSMTTWRRRLSEESIRTELCEGPLPDLPDLADVPDVPEVPDLPDLPQHPRSPACRTPPDHGQDGSNDTSTATSDRAELIERLKRGESPTWIPNRHLESLLHHHGPISPTRSRSPRLPSATSPTSLLPAAAITSEKGQTPNALEEEANVDERLRDGLSIERPRSALHSGDFTHNDSPQDEHGRAGGREDMGRGRDVGSSHGVHGVHGSHGAHAHIQQDRSHHQASPLGWLATSPPRPSVTVYMGSQTPLPRRPDAYGSVRDHSHGQGHNHGHRSGLSSLSSSLSSSFVFKHPTSPLVQSESNDEIDIDFNVPIEATLEFDTCATRNPRRHTLTTHTSSPSIFTTSWQGQSQSQSHSQSQSQSLMQTPGLGQGFGQTSWLRRENSTHSHPYQAHQPRRSLTCTPSMPFHSLAAESPPASSGFLRSRRPSISSDSSPLQHASMVGSYEESILRGRMSTTPSRPLDFLAQIGVLGLGRCKPSLRCPAHVTLPFSAVFYSYSSTPHGRSKSDDGPSPYVGMIDLENGLANSDDEARARRKVQSRNEARRAARGAEEEAAVVSGGSDVNMGGDDRCGSGDADGDAGHTTRPLPRPAPAPLPSALDGLGDLGDLEGLEGLGALDSQTGAVLSDAEARRALRSKRRSSSPKAPPGGSYRIPPRGQLQIIIKNQNKTAVKLFLVPYDLSGMEPGTKTFIRQRVFSDPERAAGSGSGRSSPSKEATAEAGSTATTAATATAGPGPSRPILRYLIHLHICSPSKGRYYLYKSIRVVFANRVPDGKEKLRNEVTLPEPRFSAYKPIRVMHPPIAQPTPGGGGGAGALLAADKAFRRRSSGFSFSPYVTPSSFDLLDSNGGGGGGSSINIGHISLSGAASGNNMPVEPIPFRPPRNRLESVTSADGSDATTTTTTISAAQTAASSQGEPPSRPTMGDGTPTGMLSSLSSSSSSPSYSKLNKGDVGYGGNAFIVMQPARGLLGSGSSPGGSPGAATEGLLSKRLRSLGVQGDLGAAAAAAAGGDAASCGRGHEIRGPR